MLLTDPRVEAGGRLTGLAVATPLRLPQHPSSCWTVLQLTPPPVRTDRWTLHLNILLQHQFIRRHYWRQLIITKSEYQTNIWGIYESIFTQRCFVDPLALNGLLDRSALTKKHLICSNEVEVMQFQFLSSVPLANASFLFFVIWRSVSPQLICLKCVTNKSRGAFRTTFYFLQWLWPYLLSSVTSNLGTSERCLVIDTNRDHLIYTLVFGCQWCRRIRAIPLHPSEISRWPILPPRCVCVCVFVGHVSLNS